MGRYNKTGIGVGIGTSNQLGFTNLSLIQKGKDNDIDIDLKELEDGIKKLEEVGVKFNKDDVVFVTTSSDNQLVWLEKGDDIVGLQHIINRHEMHFLDVFNVKKNEISAKIKEIVSTWPIVSKKTQIRNGREGYGVIYKKDEMAVLVALGLNGFIVSVYPKGGKK